ncbi:UNVERIFIED_CONTAM: hypothetical protein RMT77_002757 [Armadillidium vulgare]
MNMQVEEREEGRCPFPCNLSSLLSMNCRAKAQSLACRLQSKVSYKNNSDTEGTLLVGSDGKVRVVKSESRTYSLDDYNIESIHKNAELKKLRPIHVVTSEPTLHLCFPPHPPVKEEQSPIEQEQDSDVYFDFDLVTPPDDYVCSGDSRPKSDETLGEENEKQDRPESGCVTSVTSPIIFSVDMDLPASNAPSPLDDAALEDLSSRASDVDLETVRQLLATSQNKIDNSNITVSTQFSVKNNKRADFIGVVKSSNFLKTSSESDSSTSSTSESELSSDGGTNVPDDEKELISREKNVLRNMSYYLPPPSSYQIFHNRESDADGSEKSTTPKPKHKAIRTKCKKKKTKPIPSSSSKNESSESRDSPFHPYNLSSSPESSSVQSITLREYNKPPRHLFIRSKSVEEIPEQSPSKIIKSSHSFEKCGCDIYPCTKERSSGFEIRKEVENKVERITSKIKNKDKKVAKEFHPHSKKFEIEPQVHMNCINPYNGLEAREIKAKLEIEGGFAVSSLNEEEILQEINEAISILKRDNPDSIEQKLAKYEANDCDIFGTKPNKNESCSKQVAVASHDSTSDVTNQCQNLVSVSQLCDVCGEVPIILGESFTDEKCDTVVKNKVRCDSSYEEISSKSVYKEDKISTDMPRSKGRSKVKKVNSDSHCTRSQKVKELPNASSFPNDIPSGSSTSENGDNVELPELDKLNNFVSENQTSYLNCECNIKKSDSVENEILVCNDIELNNQEPDSVCSRIHENHIDNKCDENLSSVSKFTNNYDERTFKNCSRTLPDESVDTCNNACALNNSVNCNENCDKLFSNSNGKNSNLNKTNHNNNTNTIVKSSHNSTVVNSFSTSNSDESSCISNNEALTLLHNDLDISSNVFEQTSKIEPCNQTINSRIITTTTKDNDKPYVSSPETEYSEMNPTCLNDSCSNNKNDSEQDLLENVLNKDSNNEDFLNDEIELLPAEESSTEERSAGKEDEDESDDEILISSRFKNVANYSEKITRLSEDDGLPPPPTEVILIDYNEPIETNKEEEVEENQEVTAADLESELNRLSLEEPTVHAPSDESERSSEEKEIDLDKQLRIKRSSSLRCGKTPPGTPGRKKIVRFADALGLDLADIRTFLDGVPNVPESAFVDLRVENDPSATAESQIHHGVPSYGSYAAAASAAAAVLQSQAERILTPMFQQPGALPDFYNRLREQKVVLENVSVGNDLSVRGIVRVINEDFHKKVYIRYTFDHWRNYHEATASYVDGSCDGFSDRFSFLLWGSFLQSNGSLIFCVKYCVNSQEYWDSNRGLNYVLHCYSTPPVRTLHGKPQNDHSIQHNQDNPISQHRPFPPNPSNPARASGNFSSFVDSPNTPTDPWVTRFF